MSVDLILYFICAGVGFIGGILVSLVVGWYRHRSHVLEHAGIVMLNYCLPNKDSLSVEPKNFSKWPKYKKLVFDLELYR